MKTRKPKFVEIAREVIGGCMSQMSKKQNYFLNPLITMKKKGFIPEIWTTGTEKEDFLDGIRIRRFLSRLSLLINLFLDKDIKLIHSHLRPYIPSPLAPLSLRKCILTPHTYELGSNWFIKKLSLFFMKRFDRIIALTPYERQIYIKNGLRKDKVILFPHAIDYEFFSKKPKKSLAKIRKEYGIEKDDFVITAVSNFRKFKNLDIMINAFALFNKKVKKSKIFVVGINQIKNIFYDEQIDKRYENEDVDTIIKREKISKKVIFTGGIDYQKVKEILYISDIFVNSSDPETMGLAVYEAASTGIPLCLSNIGSFTSVFKDMAFYSPPRDKEKLANNYLRYYKNPLLRKKLGKRLKQYLKKWDYPIAMKKFNKLYSDVLS